MVNNEIRRIAKVGLVTYAKELKECGYSVRSIQDSINTLALDIILDIEIGPDIILD